MGQYDIICLLQLHIIGSQDIHANIFYLKTGRLMCDVVSLEALETCLHEHYRVSFNLQCDRGVEGFTSGRVGVYGISRGAYN